MELSHFVKSQLFQISLVGSQSRLSSQHSKSKPTPKLAVVSVTAYDNLGNRIPTIPTLSIGSLNKNFTFNDKTERTDGFGMTCPVLIKSGLIIDSYRRLDGTPDDNRPVVQESHSVDKTHVATEQGQNDRTGN